MIITGEVVITIAGVVIDSTGFDPFDPFIELTPPYRAPRPKPRPDFSRPARLPLPPLVRRPIWSSALDAWRGDR